MALAIAVAIVASRAHDLIVAQAAMGILASLRIGTINQIVMAVWCFTDGNAQRES